MLTVLRDNYFMVESDLALTEEAPSYGRGRRREGDVNVSL